MTASDAPYPGRDTDRAGQTPHAAAPSKTARRLADVLAVAGIDCVIDVGANVGQYGAMLRSAGYAHRIVSIEPFPDAHAALSRAAADDPLWEVLPPMALGADPGHATLHVSPNSDMSSLLPMTAPMRRLLDGDVPNADVSVPVARLDDVIDRCVGGAATPLLKLDVQGSEAAVLDGAPAALDRLAGLQVELSLVPVYEGSADWRRMIDRLAALGFEPALFIPGYFNRRIGRLIEMDGVFLRTSV